MTDPTPFDFFNPTAIPAVYLHVENTVHYHIGTARGKAELEQLLPNGSHLVHLPRKSEPSSAPQTYTVALFHQMRCLNIIVDAYSSRVADVRDPLLRHCMNYLRQSIPCQADTRLEPILLPLPGRQQVNH
ncbi:hypothetical protein PUNSTDRAFT_64074 [Punctularia strigosozonata HHB-11173 SS5]|uniref:uncharacterized protein n=1 Tax=Punctularia strigosozonata (strain HHB-11173) TaxID=741275 RepID=UPI0004417D61|nr:uncharacterized protein PUNSTDRAFT_64074 [Punctularia strigosozonata HHB-11173 SS5]EIN10135.1 hypothetical protein PUNSTDRAFT_64074 [Punctularia strigosozonata HHB-11173 SS5]